MIRIANLHVTNCGTVAQIGEGFSVSFEDCTGTNIAGHAILKHPSAKVTATNVAFDDVKDSTFATTQLIKFRDQFSIPPSISDSQIIFLSRKLARCKSEAQQKKVLRKNGIWKWLRQQKALDLVTAASMLIMALVDLDEWLSDGRRLNSSEALGQAKILESSTVPVPPKRPRMNRDKT